MPIFVICYTKSCKQCRNITSEYAKFISMTGNRTDLYTSTINCIENEEYCSYLNIHITSPTSILILGNNSKYWPKTYSNQAEDWNILIDNSLGGNLKRIKDSKIELSKNKKAKHMIEKTFNNGGVTYFLSIPNETSKMLHTFRKLAYRNLIYNVSFLYMVNSHIETYELRRYYTLHCFESLKGNISNLINEVQFGPLHKYDFDEWNQINSTKMFLFTRNDHLLNIQKEKLKKLSDEFGKIVRFGWMSISNETEFSSFFNYTKNDLPITIIYNPQTFCYLGTKQRTRDINSTLIEDFLNNRVECNQTYGEIPLPTPAIQPIKEDNIDCKTFLLSYLSIGLIFIGFLRFLPIRESKNE